jgi:hypothetical protein
MLNVELSVPGFLQEEKETEKKYCCTKGGYITSTDRHFPVAPTSDKETTSLLNVSFMNNWVEIH